MLENLLCKKKYSRLFKLFLPLQLHPAKCTIWFESSEAVSFRRSLFFLLGQLGLALAAAAGVDLLGVPLEQVLCLEDPAAEVAGVLRGHVDGVNVSEQVPLVRRLERAVGAPEDALVVAAVVVDRVALHANLCNIGREEGH